MLLRETPLRVLAVNMPGFSAGPEAALQLALLDKRAVAAGRAS